MRSKVNYDLTFGMHSVSPTALSVRGVHVLAAVNILDSRSLLTGLGALGVFLVLFAETGLLIGFFLPGDSLLFTAGVLTASGALSNGSLPTLIIAAALGALAGAQVGYLIGRRGGKAILNRIGRKRIHEGVERSAEMLEKYGHGKAIVLARFIPVVRTVLNPLAGMVGVPYRIFTLWQVLGGLLWTVGVIMAGYVLGSSVPNIDTYLLPIIAVIVLLSLSPLVIEVYRSRRERRNS
jgi:membrane-associated protein